jgi:hypothetical protein
LRKAKTSNSSRHQHLQTTRDAQLKMSIMEGATCSFTDHSLYTKVWAQRWFVQKFMHKAHHVARPIFSGKAWHTRNLMPSKRQTLQRRRTWVH